MDTHFQHQLEAEFNRHGFPLTSEQSAQLAKYRSELKRWNKHINLTALHDDTEVIYKHFLDSISVTEYCTIEQGQNVIDIGTGAGFPGVVLKIYNPNIRLTLIEASHKKVAFLKYLISQLDLNSAIQVKAMRAEVCAESNAFIHAYDWVLTRYVASLKKSAPYCIPLLNAIGRWVAYKSNGNDDEIRQSEKTIRRHGGKIEAIYKSSIAQLNRCYVVVECFEDES